VLVDNGRRDEDNQISNAEEDPYDFNTVNFEESGALDSSLWELKTLERHYCGTIASLMTVRV